MAAEERNQHIDKKYKSQKKLAFAVYTVIFVLLGIFISWQFHTSKLKTSEESSDAEARMKAYEDKVTELEEELAVLTGEIADLNTAYDEQLNLLASKDNDFFRLVEFTNESIEKYSLYAGVSDVTGKGIEISIDDANSLSGEVNQFMLVHDSTLLSVVNALREADAQAISINGERIVADSEILCVGTSIKVNDKKLFAPYTIKAIGNQDKLYTSFISSSIYKNINTADLLVSVTKTDNIRIVGFAGLTDDNVKYLKDKE